MITRHSNVQSSCGRHKASAEMLPQLSSPLIPTIGNVLFLLRMTLSFHFCSSRLAAAAVPFWYVGCRVGELCCLSSAFSTSEMLFTYDCQFSLDTYLCVCLLRKQLPYFIVLPASVFCLLQASPRHDASCQASARTPRNQGWRWCVRALSVPPKSLADSLENEQSMTYTRYPSKLPDSNNPRRAKGFHTIRPQGEISRNYDQFLLFRDPYRGGKVGAKLRHLDIPHGNFTHKRQFRASNSFDARAITL